MNFTFTFWRNAGELEFRFLRREFWKTFHNGERSSHDGNAIAERRCGATASSDGRFHNASLNGNLGDFLTGHSMCGSLSGVPKAVVGLPHRQRQWWPFPNLRRKLSAGRPIL